jgi:predicted nucleic acid-binding protein
MFVLDTNVVSEFRRIERADSGLQAWAAATPLSDMFLSVVTLFELERGILMKSRKDPAGGAVLRQWLDLQILPLFAGRILPVDIEVAQRCATLHVPVTRPELDAMIAATALVHGMSVVTRNVRDFDGMGVKVVCPWDAGRG